MLKKHYDIIIIGAGVTGCMLARQLSYYNVNICVIEKSIYVCSGQSKANGAIVHAGHNEEPGSLKARLCLKGNKMFPDLCKQFGVFFKQSGYVVLAFNEEEIIGIKKLEKQSLVNGVNVEIIDAVRLAEIEPNVSKKAKIALWVKDAGYVDVHRFIIAAAEHAAINGVDFIFNTEVKDLIWYDNNYKEVVGVSTDKGDYYAKLIINCAGINADHIIRKAGNNDFKFTARKGEYYIIDKSEGKILNGPVYHVPTIYGKGCMVTPSAHGNTIFGGNSVEVFDCNDISTSNSGFDYVLKKSCKLIPCIRNKKIIAGYSGIRSTLDGKDYFIGPMDGVKGLINIVGIDSPGLTSSPAIASYVKDLILEEFLNLKINKSRKTNYNIKPLFRDLSNNEKEIWLKKDPRYGRLVCRCENVTEGDIISAIHSPIPAITTDALKFKTWVGAGRCQGSFDLPRLISIIAEELKIDSINILKGLPGSNIVLGYSRDFKTGKNDKVYKRKNF